MTYTEIVVITLLGASLALNTYLLRLVYIATLYAYAQGGAELARIAKEKEEGK